MMKKARSLRRRIYVLGNALVEDDSLALKVANRLKKEIKDVKFVFLEPSEDISGKDIFFLDVAYGINKVCMINSVKKLEAKRAVSLHDFDIALNLKLMKKAGMIDNIAIIAIPVGYDFEMACKETRDYIHLTFKK